MCIDWCRFCIMYSYLVLMPTYAGTLQCWYSTVMGNYPTMQDGFECLTFPRSESTFRFNLGQFLRLVVVVSYNICTK